MLITKVYMRVIMMKKVKQYLAYDYISSFYLENSQTPYRMFNK